jgi:cell wall-associated NlpC family hydrolase
MGTKIVMNGIEYTVEDTGPLERYGVAFDVYYDDHQVAENHGHQNWEAYIADDNGSKTVEITIYNSLPTLSLSVQNGSIDTAARALLSDDELQRYYVIIETKGNRPDLFADDIYANTTEGVNWAPPGSALSDERFRNMYNEAIKYLGYPYVRGGESPDTSFDCSGFVSWVINHCGNGWNYGRLDCRELWALTMRVSEADVRPGDLVFFQGTWDVEGASHVGIVLGNGMMIHCGHPVQIASYKTEYFSAHFMGYGRLP